MKQRFITAIILIAVLAPILYFGGIAFWALAVVFGLLGTAEMVRIAEKKWPKPLKYISYAFTVALIFSNLGGVKYLFLVDCIVLISLFTMLIFCPEVQFEDIGVMFLFYNIIGMMIGGFTEFYKVSNIMPFYMAFATCFTDAGAYFVGRFLGKHKLNERISPNKTIEGAVGGFIIGSIASFLLGYFALVKNGKLPLALVIIGAITMSFIGQIGDLAFSAIKRHYGIKDFSNLFPGHGGVLDRIDSISFNTIWLYVLMLVML